jgi:hypothetical protein
VLDMRHSLTSTKDEEVRGFRQSVALLSSARPGEKSRSRHIWSILLSKLSSAPFYTILAVMGTDRNVAKIRRVWDVF